ncbi:uncharacterized protein LOC134831142 [Culicoides brevitarsis]|uniref:uncharacterized protein LOC134831142 n=1 Tax=Culicoides brevitarsis TaxID=469753 RepID=UPI00307C162A
MSSGDIIEGKLVVLGKQGVGKTSLVSKYVSNVCSNISPTIGATFMTISLNIDDIKVRLQIWDTAGQERFRSMAPLYYRNANAAILVFDITIYATFLDVKSWVLELQKNVHGSMTLALVGNKIDLEENRMVSREEATLYANSLGAAYFETSTVKDCNIEAIFVNIALGTMKMCGRKPSVENGFSSQMGAVQLAEETFNGLTTGIGILEEPSWSRDNIAHGESKHLGWCCF